MNDTTLRLDGLRVASPCTVSWQGMAGGDRVRHCGSCRQNVYDLSSMTRREAEALVRRTEGRLCVRFFRRADGTILTKDCPVGLAAVRRRLRLLGGALAAAFLGLFFAGCAKAPPQGPVNPVTGKPVMGDTNGLRPTMGEACAPTDPPR